MLRVNRQEEACVIPSWIHVTLWAFKIIFQVNVKCGRSLRKAVSIVGVTFHKSQTLLNKLCLMFV